MKNKLSVLVLILIIALCMQACAGDNNENEGSGDDTEVVLEIGGHDVCMDEIRYYAYTKQASYEAYYIAYDKEIDWQDSADDEQTLEEAVKESLLNEICKRSVINNHADEYEVELDSSDRAEAESMVDEYFENSSEALKTKINITEERLEEVFEYKILYEKMCTEYMEQNEMSVSEEDCIQAEVSVVTIEDTEDGERIAEKIAKAVKSGEDIEAAAEEYGYSSVTGNIAAGSRNGDEIEEMCLSLATGDTDWLCVDDTYYVIYCVTENDEEATETVYEETLDEAMDEAAEEMYRLWAEDEEIKIDEEKWEEITFDESIFTY